MYFFNTSNWFLKNFFDKEQMSMQKQYCQHFLIMIFD